MRVDADNRDNHAGAMTGERRSNESISDRYAALIDSIDEGIVFHDRHNRVILANPAAARILGITPEELLGRTSFDPDWATMSPDGTPLEADAHPAVVALRTGRPVTDVVLQVGRSDGTHRWVSVNAQPVFEDGSGEPTGAVVRFRDITEQRETEAALAVADTRFRLLFDNTVDAVYFFDVETLDFIDCNEATERMYGYTREQLLARDVTDVSAEPGATRDLIGRSYDGGTFQIPIRWHRRADGRIFPVSISAGAFEEAGRLIGYGLARDVSDSFETETALRLERDHSRALLGALRDGLMETDPTGVITQVNEELCTMTGFSRDELINRAMPHPFWPRIERELAQSLAGEQLGNRDVELSRSDHTTFPASVTWSSVRDAEGARVGFLAVIRDLTDRRKAERALRVAELEHHRREAERERRRLETELAQSQRLESLGRLTSGIAHDFNNLLGVVSNYATFVARAIGPDSPVADDVAAIQRSAKQAAALTRELLLFSQGQVGRLEPFDLARLVTDVVTLLRRPFGTDITLVAGPSDESALVVGERGQIEQMIVNLLLNARDALGGSGTISITTAPVLIAQGDDTGALAPGAYVVLSVVDDGAGMDPEVLERAFEPFFSTKDPEHGTGLGLATVRGIAGRAGGDVILTSERGVGTTARVFLPAADPTDPSEALPSRSTGGSETILLVDDDADVRALSRRILRDAGYHVVEAADPVEAIALANTANAALLLTDIAMPEIDGLELASRLCAQHPHLKVAFVSATARELGPDAVSRVLVDKPFDADELLFAVRHALDAAPDDDLPG